MDLSLQVADFMDKKFAKVNAHDSTGKAIRILLKKGLIGLLVVDDEEKLVGVISEKECLKFLIHQVYHEMPGGKIRDFMETDPKTIASDTPVEKLCELFLDSQTRRFPVVDSDILVGQVTRRDLLRTLHLGLFYDK